MLQQLLPWPNIVSQKYGLPEFCCQPSGSDHMQVLLKYTQPSDQDIYGVSLGVSLPINLLLGLVSSTYFGPPYALLHFSPHYKPPVSQIQRLSDVIGPTTVWSHGRTEILVIETQAVARHLHHITAQRLVVSGPNMPGICSRLSVPSPCSGLRGCTALVSQSSKCNCWNPRVHF
jgi:hypothetical protein